MLRRGVTLFWRAVKANWIPAIGIWTIGALLVWGYYRGGFVYDLAQTILSLRQKYGLIYPMCSMALFAAVLPLATQYLLVPKARATVPGRMAWLVPYWAYKGLEINLFYWLQAVTWGDGTGFWTVFIKVVVDQFIYSPTAGDITIILWMRYVARRYGEIPAGTPIAPKGWYQLYLVPVVVANWAVCSCSSWRRTPPRNRPRRWKLPPRSSGRSVRHRPNAVRRSNFHLPDAAVLTGCVPIR
jgi:hypothetical protein